MQPSRVSGPRVVYPSFGRWYDPALFSSARLLFNPSSPGVKLLQPVFGRELDSIPYLPPRLLSPSRILSSPS